MTQTIYYTHSIDRSYEAWCNYSPNELTYRVYTYGPADASPGSGTVYTTKEEAMEALKDHMERVTQMQREH